MADHIDPDTGEITPGGSGPVTFEDVRAVVGDRDPHDVNGGDIRKALGNRGSLTTIQKHLNTLRAARAAAQSVPLDAAAAPAAPAEWASIWQAAYGVAAARVLARLEVLAAERDAARTRAVTAEADVAALATSSDEATAAAEQAAVDLSAITAERDELAGQRGELAQQLIDAGTKAEEALAAARQEGEDALKAAKEKAATALRELQQQAELAARDAEIRLSEQRRNTEIALEREQQARDTVRQQQETIGALQARVDDLRAQLAAQAKGSSKE